jgi:hypothetical protein
MISWEEDLAFIYRVIEKSNSKVIDSSKYHIIFEDGGSIQETYYEIDLSEKMKRLLYNTCFVTNEEYQALNLNYRTTWYNLRYLENGESNTLSVQIKEINGKLQFLPATKNEKEIVELFIQVLKQSSKFRLFAITQ